jgi:O-antigen ligase
MRRLVWLLLLLFTFTIPWEYSMDLGEPLGNVARIVGLLLLLVAIPATLERGNFRPPGPLQWAVLALYLWFCCSYFWTIEPAATTGMIRAFFQEAMIVWLVWEFAESPSDLRALLRAWVAGSWVLAILTLANFASPQAIIEGQIRFAAGGQDPNDVARFLDLGFPLAALQFDAEPRWPSRLLAAGYLPLGLVAVVLTASRGGFLAAIVALVGCGILLARTHIRAVFAGTFALPAVAAAFWFTVPHGTLDRLATISEQIRGGDLNQRWNIWSAGWHAFVGAPLLGSGAGSFVTAAGQAPFDTAHNTALSILVSGGLCAFSLALAIVALAVWSVCQAKGPLRLALAASLVVWAVTSLVATVETNRTTWLLMALVALAGRLAVEEPAELAACFPDRSSNPEPALAAAPAL